MERTNGYILFWNYDKKYGFIRTFESPHEEFFFHKNETNFADIHEKTKVSFRVEKSINRPGKLMAIDISKTDNK